MGDLFDDFMRELQRRRAAAEGRAPRHGADAEGGDAAEEDAAEEDAAEHDAAGSTRPSTAVADDADDADREGAGEAYADPATRGARVAHHAGRGRHARRRTGRRRTPPSSARSSGAWAGGGGGRDRPRGAHRRAVVDLWTDVIWYTSVGFDSVFWTRLGPARPVRRRLVLATVVLLANLWIAGRLTPRSTPSGPAACARSPSV
jgi:hypothetical protein